VVVAPGLMVMGISMFMGKISGAHLNPAVSIAFSLRGDFPWKRVPGYVIVQLVGATLASLVLWGVIDVSARYGGNYPASGSGSSARSASARTSRSPGCGGARSRAPR
jgi:aquaporin Z